MMSQSDILRLIRTEITKTMNVILPGAAGENATVVAEDIKSMYPGMPTQTQRPVAHPYGFVSRAPADCIQVVGRNGHDPSNRLVLGHRDGDRPVDLESGEAVLYSLAGYQVRAGAAGVTVIGPDGGTQSLVQGDLLAALLIEVLNLLASHTHAGNGAPPTEGPQFTQLVAENLDPVNKLATNSKAGF